jgi:pimeloyl-ACP methyl ester carboxylesterase
MSESEGGGAWTEERCVRNERRATREGAASEPPGDEREILDHSVAVPGGSLYYRTQGQGPPLVLVGGGPSNADTLTGLAAQLDDGYTVVTYDRRGYSRSHLADPAAPVTIGEHAGDVGQIIDDLGRGPAMVFGSSIGAVIALELAAAAPSEVARLVVHEPPLGQFLAGTERETFDKNDDEEDAGGGAEGSTGRLNALAGAIGVRRGAQAGPGSGTGAGAPAGGGDKARAADVELFVTRDMPAVGEYHLDLARLAPLAGRIAVTAGRESRDFYPHLCAERLAGALGLPVTELPGHHAGMIQHPAEFAAELRGLLG